MASQVSYSSNPRSYAQLLAAGISPAQIREAINSGLNPAQLPPEYFGLTSGYSPQSVGTGAPQQIGGIDIPPADLGDSYGSYSPPTTPPANWNLSDQTGSFGASNVPPLSDAYPVYQSFGTGYPLPTISGTGFPIVDMSSGSMNTGGDMTLGTLPDWGELPTSYGLNTPVNYGGGSMSTGGAMTLGSLPDWGYLPTSDQYGWTAPNYSPQFDSSAYGGFSTGSGALPYSEPTPLPSPTESYQPNTGGNDIANFGGSMDITGGQTLGYVPNAGYNTYDAGDGTTYVYDSDWNYLYTQQAPQGGGGGQGGGSTQSQGGSSGPMSPFSAWGGGITATGAGFSPNYTPFSSTGTGFGGYGYYGQGAGPAFSGGGTGARFDSSQFVSGGVDPTAQGGEGIGGSGGFANPNSIGMTLKMDAPSPAVHTSIAQSKRGG